jgi:transposase
MPSTIELLLQTYDHLCDQIDKLEEQVEQMAEHDATCQLLMTVPGVGPRVSLAFRSQLDDPARFESSNKLASYLALVPGENTTGGKIRRTGMIKAGPTYLKALLVQAAWAAWRTRPNEPMVLWARAIADKRGRRIAIIALARKLSVVMWSMWKNGEKYDPSKAARARATSMSEVSQPS